MPVDVNWEVRFKEGTWAHGWLLRADPVDTVSNWLQAATKYVLKELQIYDYLFMKQSLTVTWEGIDIEDLFFFTFTAFQNIDRFVRELEMNSTG